MEKRYIIIGVLVIAAILGAMVLLSKNNFGTGNQIKVSASFYPLAFFAKEIGGDKINVTTITPAGAEPHEYEPTAQDIARISQSQLLILNGSGVEPWAKSLDTSATTIAVSEGLATETEGEETPDPHVWLSPLLAKEMAERIAAALISIDPSNGEYYQLTLTALKLKLDILDAQFTQTLNSCAQKNIITSHAAFGYMAEAYGFIQVPIAGLSPEQEPSAQQLAQVTKFIKDNNVKYVFFESLVSPKLSDTLAKETGAQTLELNPIEGLTNDEIADGQNYITKMETNLANLKTALECK